MPRVEDELRDVWNTWIEDEDFGLVGALPATGVAAVAASAARAVAPLVGGNSSPPSNDVSVNPAPGFEMQHNSNIPYLGNTNITPMQPTRAVHEEANAGHITRPQAPRSVGPSRAVSRQHLLSSPHAPRPSNISPQPQLLPGTRRQLPPQLEQPSATTLQASISSSVQRPRAASQPRAQSRASSVLPSQGRASTPLALKLARGIGRGTGAIVRGGASLVGSGASLVGSGVGALARGAANSVQAAVGGVAHGASRALSALKKMGGRAAPAAPAAPAEKYPGYNGPTKANGSPDKRTSQWKAYTNRENGFIVNS